MKSILKNLQTNKNKSSFASKLNWFIFFTLLILILNLNAKSTTEKTKEISTSNKETKTTKTIKSQEQEELTSTLSSPLQGIFWIQRMYPGNDVLDLLQESEYTNSKKYLEVNDEIIYIAKSLQKKSEIEDSLNIKDIYDATYDNYQTAKCCSRVSYEEFPLTNSLKNFIPAVKASQALKNNKKKSFLETSAKVLKVKVNEKAQVDSKSQNEEKICPKTNKKTKSKDIPASKINPVTSPSPSKKQAKRIQNSKEIPNLCILIHIPDEAKWRICSTSKKEINKLYIKISYSVIKLKSKNNPKIMEKIISNPQIFTKPTVGNWSWDKQEKWGNRCNSSFMQSPIDISSSSVKKPKTHFDMGMNLKESFTLVKKNFGEVIVVFTNFAGVLKLSVGGNYLNFTPQYMSFRFPGESIIDGKRSEGDIQLHFVEMKNKVPGTALTNGLIMNIPLKVNNKKTNIKELDDLNMDFWRHEINKKGSYTPKRYLNKKLLRFSLSDLSKRIVNLEPEYMIHLGSETIPPCRENIIHITIDKPLELPACQFHLLRESSLLSKQAKVIHTRYEVPNSDRPVYHFNKNALSYIPSISGFVPESYRKYTLPKKISKRKSANAKGKNKTKTKTVVRIVNGEPVVKKIKVNVKAKKNSILGNIKINRINKLNRRQNKGGFGPGYKGGKNRLFTKAGVSKVKLGLIDKDEANCGTKN